MEFCCYCAMDLAGSDNPCCRCREHKEHDLQRVIALGPWMGALREWLSQLKYGGDARMARWPASRLFEIWQKNWPCVPIIPVPPRRGKIRKEGPDAVQLLGEELKRRSVPICKALRRLDRLPQKALKRHERLERRDLRIVVKGGNLPAECVLLDDVMTTGATLSFCARVLCQHGVKNISAIVVCRD